MKIKTSFGEKCFTVGNSLLMCFLMFIMIYPMLHVLNASLSDPTLVTQHRGILLWPMHFTLGTYDLLFENPMIVRGFLNSCFYLVVGTTINVILTIFGAYSLSRKNVLLGKPLLLAIVFTMFFQGGLIPLYLTVKWTGLLNTRAALIIPHVIHAYNLLILRTGFAQIPDSFEESAKIDGANDIRILFQIMIPLTKAFIAVIVLYYGVWHWNSWFRALIYLNDRVKYPIQLILREILILSETADMTIDIRTASKGAFTQTLKYGVVIVATVPILLIYPFIQKYFTKGVMIGGIKE